MREHLQITFVCGHSRPTRSAFDPNEIYEKAAWIGGYARCDNCHEQRLITDIDKIKE